MLDKLGIKVLPAAKTIEVNIHLKVRRFVLSDEELGIADREIV